MLWIDLRFRELRKGLGGALLLLLYGGCGLHATAQPAADTSKWIQVRLHHQTTIESAALSPNRGTMVVQLPGSGAPILKITPADTIRLGRRERDVYAKHDDAHLYGRAFHLVPTSEATWTLNVAAESTRTYTGSLHITPADSGTGVQVVNRVRLPEYVASVVASEYGLDDQAGTRAMAVVARTYGLFSTKKRFDGEYDQVDGTASQVYRGVGVVTEAAREAARATRGEILTYNGDPIQAVYFSSSGGHTASNEDVWTNSDPIPYLRGKRDPYDRPSPYHRWSARVNRQALLQALSLHQNTSVNGFLLGDRSPNGRLRTIKILRADDTTTEIEASTFRSVVNEGVKGTPLNSTWFDARRDGPVYVFEGRGHGHGVGLNQWGAHTMAKRGKSYREILKFYYTGVQIQQLDGTPARPPVAQNPTTPAPDSTSPRIGW
ncbi:MAG: SpoIID/LytB domain-containing protein [Salinibacter sp.]